MIQLEILPEIKLSAKATVKSLTLLINHTIYAVLLLSIFALSVATGLFRSIQKQILFIGCALAFALTVTYFSKWFVGRARPVTFVKTGEYGFYLFQKGHRYHSFPSSHAITAYSLMTSIYLIYRKHFIALFLVATALSFTRVLLRQHYVSDVLFSSLISMVTGYIAYEFFAKYSPLIDKILSIFNKEVSHGSDD